MDKNPQSTLDVFSVDTDVFVLLLGHFPLLPKSTTLLRKKGDRISIEESYRRLGPKRTEALIGWYAFKGTDNTGLFAGKGVLSHFNAFMQADEEILKAFTAFGLTQELYQHVSLIKWGGICVYSTRPQTSVRIVLENLGGHYLHKKGKEGQQLPPTRATLVPHTSRAYSMALLWKLSKAPCPKIPSPTDYCWETIEGQLKPVFCVNAPALI